MEKSNKKYLSCWFIGRNVLQGIKSACKVLPLAEKVVTLRQKKMGKKVKVKADAAKKLIKKKNVTILINVRKNGKGIPRPKGWGGKNLLAKK